LKELASLSGEEEDGNLSVDLTPYAFGTRQCRFFDFDASCASFLGYLDVMIPPF
jgi:hypothetical protein